MKTGIITFGLEGKHYLSTFDGRWLIPDETIDAAWVAIQQTPGWGQIQDETLAGKLARGVVFGDVIKDISYLVNRKEWPDRALYGQQDERCSCMESNEDVLSVIYDPNGNALSHGEIVMRLNEVPELRQQIRQLEANVGGGDTAMRAMGYEIDHLQDWIERLKSFAKSFLNPEENGRAVSAYIRDEARAALGMERVERVQP